MKRKVYHTYEEFMKEMFPNVWKQRQEEKEKKRIRAMSMKDLAEQHIKELKIFFREKKRIKIKEGWAEAGKKGFAVGRNVMVEGQMWTPVLWGNSEDDLDWIKTAAIDFL